MKKFTLVALNSDKEAILNAFSKSKVVQLAESAELDKVTSKENSESQEKLAERIALVEDAVAYIKEGVMKYNASFKGTDGYKKVTVPKNSMAAPKTELTFDAFMQMEQGQVQLMEQVAYISELRNQKAELEAKLSKLNTEIDKLSLYRNLPHPTTWYRDTQNVAVQIGSVPVSAWDKLQAVANDYPMSEVSKVGTYGGNTLVVIVAHKDEKQLFDAVLPLGYAKSNVVCDILPSAMLNDLTSQRNAAKKALVDNAKAITACAQYIPQFEVLLDYLGFELKKVVSQGNMQQTGSTFVAKGFFPAESQSVVEEVLDKITDCRVLYVEDIGEDEFAPTLIRNKGVVKNFEMITNSYTPPTYHEVDPNPTMAWFYFVIFGLMTADIGYGLLLCAVGLFAKFYFKQNSGTANLMKMFGFCGISAVVVGVLFGSFFSYELYGYTLLNDGSLAPKLFTQWFGIKQAIIPAGDKQPMVMMVISLYFGVLHMIGGFCNNAAKAFKRGDPWAAFLDCFVWVVFFAGAGLALFAPAINFTNYDTWVNWLAGLQGKQLETVQLIGKIGLYMVLGAVGIVLIFGGRKKKGLGKIIGGLGGIYGIINYFGDVMSYIRIFGLMLTSALMGVVINDLAAMISENGSAFGYVMSAVLLLVMHLFNLVLGLLSIYIHNGRLQYVEFFGKFYEGDGQLFTPFGSDTKYTLIKD
ncbi:MAG: hypothetical protein IKC47_03160 [Clostridia bacterium]|nr:hypothetical protein [Clostridia bacterium]